MVLTILEFQARQQIPEKYLILDTIFLCVCVRGETKRNNANYNVNVCLIPQCYSNWSFDKLQVHKVIFNVVNVSYFRGPVCLPQMTEKDEANPIFK